MCDAQEFFTQVLNGQWLADLCKSELVKTFVNQIMDLNSVHYNLLGSYLAATSDESTLVLEADENFGLLKSTEQLAYVQEEIDELTKKQDFVQG